MRVNTHPCPRKREHVDWLVDSYTRPTDVILDPFAGSGTTLLAARAFGRLAIGIEMTRKYCVEFVEEIENPRPRSEFPRLPRRPRQLILKGW